MPSMQIVFEFGRRCTSHGTDIGTHCRYQEFARGGLVRGTSTGVCSFFLFFQSCTPLGLTQTSDISTLYQLHSKLRFHKRQNVADGFLTNFMVAQSDFKSNGEEGFAFVMHRDQYAMPALVHRVMHCYTTSFISLQSVFVCLCTIFQFALRSGPGRRGNGLRRHPRRRLGRV